MNICLEDREGRRGVKSLGLSIPAPMTFESRLRKLVREAGNLSQRRNRRLSPNRFSMRRWWRTVRAIDVLPIPPAPTRAMELRPSARPTILSMRLLRPKQSLGGGGGAPPSILDSALVI